MKIAILVPNFSKYSGDARVVELQAENFIRKGDEVSVFALAADIKSENTNLFIIGMPRSLLFERFYRLLFPLDFVKVIRWVPKLKKYDLIISHLYPMNWMAFLAKKVYGVKYTYWYHGIPDPEFYPNLHERIYLKLFISMTKLTVTNIDCAVSVSKAAQAEFKRYTGLESRVIYNKADLKRFNKEVDGSEIRKKHQLGNCPVILNVGRVCPQKGAHLLIEAFETIHQKIPTAKLVIVGKHTYDYYSKELKDRCDSSVIFTGYVSDEELSQYYAMCDLYATCSLWETFNIPLAEAQACGKPVVAFDIGPHSEVVNENGVLVKVEDVREFADKCVQKLFELRSDLVENE